MQGISDTKKKIRNTESGKEKPGTNIRLLLQDILFQITDEDHPMTQKEILQELEGRGFTINRKRLSDHLKSMMLNDERIHCSIKSRKGEEYSLENAPEDAIYTDFYYQHLFSRSEMQAIVYNIVFARHLPAAYKKEIVSKMESLNPFAFKHHLENYIQDDAAYKGQFFDLFMNMEDLDDAITNMKPVSFKKTYYKPDKTLYVSKVEFIVMPLAIVAGRGDYYLLSCPYALKGVSIDADGKLKIKKKPEKGETLDTVSFIGNLSVDPKRLEEFTYPVRLDRICELKILDESDFPEWDEMKKAAELRSGIIKAQEHASKNTRLSSGRMITARFRLTTRNSGIFSRTKQKDCDLTDVIDCFGKSSVTIQEEGQRDTERGKESSYLIRVETNEGTFRDFAKEHFESIQIISPKEAREEMMETLKKAYDRMKEAKE